MLSILGSGRPESGAEKEPSEVPNEHAERAVEYVRGLQRDGRLLVRHLARRADRTLSPAGLTGAPASSALSGRLLADPVVLATEPSEVAALASHVDTLSRCAAPATATTIRLTGAYLRVAEENGEPPPAVRRQVKALRWWMKGIIVVAVLTSVAAVLLLAHVDDGRRTLQQLHQRQTALSEIYAQIPKLPDDAWTIDGKRPAPDQITAAGQGILGLPRCPSPDEGRRATYTWLRPLTPEASALCERLNDLLIQQQLVFARLAAWNCRSARLLPSSWFAKADPCALTKESVPPEVDPRAWQATEIRVAASMSLLTGFILPLLLSCVGGCAYALRRLDQHLRDWTLEERDGLHAGLRVLLATMLGGLLGVVWSGDEPVHLAGFALSLAAAAFFVGFALEVVFSVIESMINGVAGKLGTTPAPVVIMAPSASPARVGEASPEEGAPQPRAAAGPARAAISGGG